MATEKHRRSAPASTGEGEYYHIEVRPKGQFTTFRVQDVGDKGHVQRVAGKRESGSWDDHAWLISKEDAHPEGGTLVGNSQEVQDVLDALGSKPEHVKGDIYKAKPRPNVPEKDKPTPAQKKAQMENIKKAQAARRNKT
jgi:hypothetical protein